MYVSNRPLAGATTRVVVADSADHERTAETMARLARERQDLSQGGSLGDRNAAIETSTTDFQGAMAFFQRSPGEILSCGLDPIEGGMVDRRNPYWYPAHLM